MQSDALDRSFIGIGITARFRLSQLFYRIIPAIYIRARIEISLSDR